MCNRFIGSPNDKNWDWSNVTEFADNTLHVILTEMVGFFSYRIEKIVGKKRKCWLSEFSPFLTEEFINGAIP